MKRIVSGVAIVCGKVLKTLIKSTITNLMMMIIIVLMTV